MSMLTEQEAPAAPLVRQRARARAGPVFVDASGARRVRAVRVLVGLAAGCLGYLLVLAVALLGGPTPDALLPWPSRTVSKGHAKAPVTPVASPPRAAGPGAGAVPGPRRPGPAAVPVPPAAPPGPRPAENPRPAPSPTSSPPAPRPSSSVPPSPPATAVPTPTSTPTHGRSDSAPGHLKHPRPTPSPSP